MGQSVSEYVSELKNRYISLHQKGRLAPQAFEEAKNDILSLCASYADTSLSAEAMFFYGYLLFRDLETSHAGEPYDMENMPADKKPLLLKSIKLLERAHALKSTNATVFLGRILADNAFVIFPDKDIERGFCILENAIASEAPYALYHLARLSTLKTKPIKNETDDYYNVAIVRAMDCAAKLKKLHHAGGYLLEHNWYTREDAPLIYDLEAAFHILKDGVEHSRNDDLLTLDLYHEISFKLGLAYFEGIGCAPDQEKGLYYIREAEYRNYLPACAFLARLSEAVPTTADMVNTDEKASSPIAAILAKAESGQDVMAEETYTYEDDAPTFWHEDLEVAESGDGFYAFSSRYIKDDKPIVTAKVWLPDAEDTAWRDRILSGKAITEKLITSQMNAFNFYKGQQHLKTEIHLLLTQALVSKARQDKGLATLARSPNFIFSGAPGTGKTHMARIIGRILYRFGILARGAVIEVDENVLAGEYRGWTQNKTILACLAAQDSILLLDEAYKLNQSDYGHEILTTLMNKMDDPSSGMMLIACGYAQDMENFLTLNPGLRSRFTQTILFHDLDNQDCLDLYYDLCKRYDYILTPDAETKLKAYFKSLKGLERSRYGNGRGVQKLFEASIAKQASRLLKGRSRSKKALMQIVAEDIPANHSFSADGVTYFPTN